MQLFIFVQKGSMLKVEARPQLFSLFYFMIFSPAPHSQASSCHQWLGCGRCLKKRVEVEVAALVLVLVLVSWGPEEAAGMMLTIPPSNRSPCPSLHRSSERNVWCGISHCWHPRVWPASRASLRRQCHLAHTNTQQQKKDIKRLAPGSQPVRSRDRQRTKSANPYRRQSR